MMISDGMGPASVAFARSYYQYIHDLPYDHQMPLDTIHVGQSRTRSASTLVTDSAAGATAFSCALKTYNGAVGVDPEKHPCGTVLESAKHHHGMLTGLVATSRITHATPASFSAHVVDRDQENQIAAQQIGDNPLGRSVDLLLGGGSCHFLAKSDRGSCRGDNRHLLQEAKEKYGWKTQPSLSEMADSALDILSRESGESGFFLVIEGSRIDMAAHSNDPVAHLHDILEYQNTVDRVKKFVDAHPETLLISTSDHETGGLSLARQVSTSYPEYLWYPDVLTRAKSSTVGLAKQLSDGKNKLTRAFVTDTILRDSLGITDATKREINTLMGIKREKPIDLYLADMISLRAQLGWATHGHSGVDVNLYAYGRGSEHLRGSHENIDIGHWISQFLDLDLAQITELLNKGDASFHLDTMTDEEKARYTAHLDHYHSDPSHLHHKAFQN
ncbi:alkaline-phosphatase-like protein [Syncephalastrum racemosum]|uniref:Alkaline phosphatase n=1 Tax=Syncephalastrum racemosum TaxID=13706 RepID=A0A1X2HF94_SYNRA|nr:alkaline-phosphatase-like protein [Syncephalastrum racemosum]